MTALMWCFAYALSVVVASFIAARVSGDEDVVSGMIIWPLFLPMLGWQRFVFWLCDR
jgi:hypothetical protein